MNVPAQTVQFEITDLQPTFLDYIQSQKDENTRTFNIQFLFEGDVLSLSGCTATATVTINNIMIEQELACAVDETNNYVTVVVHAPHSGVMAVQVTLTDGTNTLAMPRPLFVRVARDIAETAQIDDNTHGSFAEVVREVADARGNYATLAQAINAKMDADDATVYHVDRTTTNVTYNADNPKIIYVKAIINGQEAVVFTANGNYYQFALCKNGAFLIRELTGGGSTTYNAWTPAFAGSISASNSSNINIAPSVAAVVSYVANAVSVKENTANKATVINGDNIASTVLFPTIKAVVDYLAANYIGNGSGTVTETNLATALKNSLYRVDNTTENVVYNADNPRIIYTNARVNGNKPTLVFTLGDDSQLAMYKDGHLYCRTYANGAYGSWIDLKATSIGEGNKTSGAYPTVQAVYNFVTAFVASSISGKANTTDVNTALDGKEDLSNKVPNKTAMDNLNSETQYPSIKTMVQYADEKASDVLGEVSDVKAFIGYTDSDILGLCADFENKRFTRLASAEGLTAGEDFDGFSMFGGRRRCAVSADGAINAYYDPDDHTAFDARVAAGDDVMVYQPKFYYKVVPLKLEKQANGTGFHLRKANYYVTAAPHAGFKLHPLFLDANGREVDYALLSAYEASYFYTDGSNNSVCFRDGVDTASAIDADAVLKSVPNVKPISGRYKAMTKANLEMLAQRKSLGWHLDTIRSVSANQLLMAVELGTFNSQSAVGLGVVSTPNADPHNGASLTGSTAALGNVTGMAAETVYDVAGTETPYSTDGKLAVSYRGVENPWGNIFKHINGINLCGDGGANGGRVYIADDFSFNESARGEMTISGTDYHYPFAGFTAASAGGWISAFGYGDERYDWLFIPSAVNENDANNAVPVGDYYFTRSLDLNTFRATRFGGANNVGKNGGEFCWYCDINAGAQTRDTGGRLMYVPTAAE